MTDRQTQAIFAAIEAFNGGTNTADVNARHGFIAGAEWADANPQPRTITADEFEKAVRVLWSSNDGGSMESWGAQAQELLSTLGVEVTDDE